MIREKQQDWMLEIQRLVGAASAQGVSITALEEAVDSATAEPVPGSGTQLTDKTTGVTVDEATGQITMNNAALGAATAVSFVVTCAACTATSIPRVAIVSGGTVGSYLVGVSAVTAGAFTITLYNLSGGSLSEAVVLNYSVSIR